MILAFIYIHTLRKSGTTHSLSSFARTEKVGIAEGSTTSTPQITTGRTPTEYIVGCKLPKHALRQL